MKIENRNMQILLIFFGYVLYAKKPHEMPKSCNFNQNALLAWNNLDTLLQTGNKIFARILQVFEKIFLLNRTISLKF